MVDRAKRLTSEQQDYNKELVLINEILIENGFPKNALRNTKETKKKPSQDPTQEQDDRIFCTLPYIRNVTDKIKNILRPQGIKTFFRPINQIRNFYTKTKDKTEDSEISGVVYELECKTNSCSKIYIGQTSQRLIDRVNQHKTAIKNEKPEKSAIAQHVLDEDHYDIGWGNPRILHKEKDWKKRCFKEQWEIVKSKGRNMNIQEDFLGFPDTYKCLFT